ncbi:serine hydrolase domain-containing protein [Pseudalkalibacillus sp. A8]|uniref:serine hydrolase domain-containing protein n=1 Tax=Pseudalkalibacillus sp. A8 TaxID=3382641 RepID=UPI0038B690B9
MGLTKELDAILEEAIRHADPGCVVSVIRDGTTIYEKAVGYRQMVPVKLPLAVDTIFDIASLTKIVTTTMILQLMSEGKFHLHTSLDRLLSEPNPILQAHFADITIYQLMTHSSGLLNWHPFYTENLDFFEQMAKFEARFFCGKKVRYSDLNFILLGKVIEETTGESIKEAFHRLIKTPLKLKSMAYGPVEPDNVATTEFGNQIEMKMCRERGRTFANWRNREVPICGEVNDGNTHYFFDGISGHAGLFATAEDVCKIGRIYTDAAIADQVGIDRSFIQAAGTKLIDNRALGFEFTPVFPDGFGHTGFTGTSMFVRPSQKTVAVLLTNRLHQDGPANLDTLRKTVHETVCRY